MSTYHHGNLRPSLIETGTELARAEGPEGVALREVARRAGVSHNAAYRHFSGKDALLTEIAQVGMQRLGEAMQAELARVAETDDGASRALARLRAAGRVYVEFAFAEPGLFRTAFSACPDPRTLLEGDSAVAADPFEILVDAIDDLVAESLVDPARRDAVVLLCWTAVHGYATLHLDGPLRGATPAEREAALTLLLDQVERSVT